MKWPPDPAAAPAAAKSSTLRHRIGRPATAKTRIASCWAAYRLYRTCSPRRVAISAAGALSGRFDNARPGKSHAHPGRPRHRPKPCQAPHWKHPSSPTAALCGRKVACGARAAELKKKPVKTVYDNYLTGVHVTEFHRLAPPNNSTAPCGRHFRQALTFLPTTGPKRRTWVPQGLQRANRGNCLVAHPVGHAQIGHQTGVSWPCKASLSSALPLRPEATINWKGTP